jgi:hypothetical protein
LRENSIRFDRHLVNRFWDYFRQRNCTIDLDRDW